MYSKFVAGSIIALAFLFASACATDHSFTVPGEKVDSGLGDLPPYSQWADHPELSRLVVRDDAAPAQLAATTR